MNLIRVIPCLTISNTELVKTINFKKPNYIGDPINAVRIFNDKEVDELILLDISPNRYENGPNFKHLEEISSEAFMPFAYGGGIKSLDHIEKIFSLGAEKVVINSQAIEKPEFIKEAVKVVGGSGIVVSIDIYKNWRGKYKIFQKSGNYKTNLDLMEFVKIVGEYGVGEIFINSINNDGRMNGFDLEIIKKISNLVSVPLIVCGGAGTLNHFKEAALAGASGLSGGSIFIYHGKNKGILITYPERKDLERIIDIR